METQPATNHRTLVPAIVKSCLTCRFAGLPGEVGEPDRRCVRQPVDGSVIYPTCLDERGARGRCGPTGVFHDTFRAPPAAPYKPRERAAPIIEAQLVLPDPTRNLPTWRRQIPAPKRQFCQTTPMEISPFELWVMTIVLASFVGVAVFLICLGYFGKP